MNMNPPPEDAFALPPATIEVERDEFGRLERHIDVSVKEDVFEEGTKFDEDKLRYDLIPCEFMEAIAWILTFGAMKYKERNWEKGMSWSRIFAALMRHMWAWFNGEEKDPETGKSHLWHAAACICFLVVWEARKNTSMPSGLDDRPGKAG